MISQNQIGAHVIAHKSGVTMTVHITNSLNHTGRNDYFFMARWNGRQFVSLPVRNVDVTSVEQLMKTSAFEHFKSDFLKLAQRRIREIANTDTRVMLDPDMIL